MVLFQLCEDMIIDEVIPGDPRVIPDGFVNNTGNHMGIMARRADRDGCLARRLGRDQAFPGDIDHMFVVGIEMNAVGVVLTASVRMDGGDKLLLMSMFIQDDLGGIDLEHGDFTEGILLAVWRP